MKNKFNCTHSCTGLYADVVHTWNTSESFKDSQILALIESYNKYKKGIARNIYFNGEKRDGGMSVKKHLICQSLSISVGTLPYNVQLVNIYLSTATFDEIEKDVKVTNHNEGHHGVHFHHCPGLMLNPHPQSR